MLCTVVVIAPASRKIFVRSRCVSLWLLLLLAVHVYRACGRRRVVAPLSLVPCTLVSHRSLLLFFLVFLSIPTVLPHLQCTTRSGCSLLMSSNMCHFTSLAVIPRAVGTSALLYLSSLCYCTALSSDCSFVSALMSLQSRLCPLQRLSAPSSASIP